MVRQRDRSNEQSPTPENEATATPEPETAAEEAAVPVVGQPVAETAAAPPAELSEKEKEAMAAAAKRRESIAAEIANGNEMLEPPAEEDEGAGPSIKSRLTPAEIMGDLRKSIMTGKIKMEEEGTTDLYTLFGRATNLRDGFSDYGPWTALVGEFEAIRVDTGEVFIGKEAFIPGPAGDTLASAARALIVEALPEVTDKNGKVRYRTYKTNGDSVELACMVAIVINKRSGGAPYQFEVKPIQKFKRADTLAKLREKAMKYLTVRKQELAALPAPKKESQSAA